MSERRRLFISMLVMMCTCGVVALVSIRILYTAAYKVEQERLVEIAQSQARLIDATAQNEKMEGNENREILKEVMLQINAAYKNFTSFGETGEFILGKREGDKIVFLFHNHRKGERFHGTIPLASKFAAPMRLALEGKSGTIVVRDYRGAEIIAAYAPMKQMGLGVVVEMELREVRAPFVRAGIILGFVALAIVLAGAALISRLSNPLINKLQKYAGELEKEIEERRRAELAMRDSEERFRHIVENTNAGYFFLDRQGVLRDANRAFVKMYGYSEAEEILGKHYSEVQTDDLEKTKAFFNLIFEGDDSYSAVEFKRTCRNGHVGHHTFSAGPVSKEGKIVGAEGFIIDTTERRQAEERLLEEKNKLGSIVDAMQDGLTIRNLDYELIYQSDLITGMFGNRLGEKCHKVFEGIDEICEDCPVESSFRDGKSHAHVKEVTLPSGEVTWWENIANPIKDADGNITACLEIARNITERKRNEEELLKLRKIESTGLLAGGIAHDFNNALASILATIDYAAMTVRENPEKTINTLSSGREAVLKARNLTKQLLTFARGGAPILRPGAIGDLLRDTASFVLSGSKSRCELDIPKDLWNVAMDAGQIGQVIQNLTINADQAMPNGGVIRVSAENIAVAYGEVEPLCPGDYVKVSVSDSGIGIRDENLQKIFDPYFTTKEKGHGLGLATTFSIIKKHNGHIYVESVPGEGTTFVFFLPVTEMKISDVSETRPAARPALGGRILIMDDEALLRDIIAKSLRNKGYVVEVASEGEEAVSKYADAFDAGAPFDVVILDLTIPGGMDGRQTIGKLLNLDPGVRAIVSSGYSSDPVMARYAEFGFRGCVEKPYEVGGLIKAIQFVMSEK